MKITGRTVALTPSTYELLRTAAFERRITQRQLAEQALRTFLTAAPDRSTATPPPTRLKRSAA